MDEMSDEDKKKEKYFMIGMIILFIILVWFSFLR